MGVALLRSTSILPIFTLPAYSVASSSTIGAMARHGPHQAAQKSKSTGVSDFRTSWSKFESVTSTIPFPAIVPPTLEILEHAATIVTPVLDAFPPPKSQEQRAGGKPVVENWRPEAQLKKRPEPMFRTPRQPSPRTAKPRLDSRRLQWRCKCHF